MGGLYSFRWGHLLSDGECKPTSRREIGRHPGIHTLLTEVREKRTKDQEVPMLTLCGGRKETSKEHRGGATIEVGGEGKNTKEDERLRTNHWN